MKILNVSDLRLRQIKFSAKLLIGALVAGTLISILAEMLIYKVSAEAVEYIFQDLTFR